ncbi:cbb3-type cytochrome c oxidase subunit 3 [Pseudorhodobacter sp.]|uniref:cbb3-type cytochrome oxidase subunit 3 n=1 Tax=Pseudorhodobacter sp. TaxID=1934400 RepID=UPI00264962ED|nr:cbb3-type cytochrome c oxidase subunit 3 [Pseudorhodobacter sp.]MDN5785608.1 cbb3-type cytochrome c oxidase subunit 3 [Pseudorhodobacter sp.]
MTHETLVIIAKTVGLFYLMGFFILVVIHTYRPSRKAQADLAANSILTTEDRPCTK